MEDLVVIEKYGNILSSNGIKDEISQVVIKRPEILIGEHMGSICEYVTVHFKDDKRSRKELFLKRQMPTPAPEMGKMMAKIMVKEGDFLTSVVEELKDLCDQKLGSENSLGVELQALFPKIYFADENEIIMENMTSHGYFMLKKTDLQDFHSASLVMRSIAKLHAVSYCVVKAGGGKDAFVEQRPHFKEVIFSTEQEETLNMFDPTFAAVLKMMEGNDSKAVKVALEKLTKFNGQVGKTMADGIAKPALFDCMNHGDCWNNNMLFSPEAKLNPGSANLILIDLQLARIGSPCLDIGYYMFTSVKPEVRKRTKELLKIHFDTMSELVERMGENFPFTFEEFCADYGVKSQVGFFMGLIVIMALDGIKDHDTSKSSGNFVEEWQDILENWVKENPGKAETVTATVLDKLADFELFGKL